ncbi:baseplate J/gp47 family protein [Pseudomonas putida]|uniref:baseplate J/gp47 family protein n=1 Tax=Pseudomonas putida TaxID=303 RepID=UPI004046ED15
MPYVAPTFDAIRSRSLRDIRSQLPDADITSDSDYHVRASSVSAIAEGIHQQVSWTARQIFPDTADFEELKRHAATRGVHPKLATPAGGVLSVTGAAYAVIGPGLSVRHVASGLLFSTSSEVALSPSGSATLFVSAVDVGSSLNGLEGECVFISPPIGVDAACILAETFGGTDNETQESLLARYLDVLRNPPSGGNEADYRRWALSVDGVSTVLVLPKRRGGNAIDVVITSAGGPSTPVVISTCQGFIESVAPAGADIWVFTPEIINLDIRAQVKLAAGYSLESVQQPVESVCKQLIGPLTPLETLYWVRLASAISSSSGIIDLVLLAPTGNVQSSADPAVVKWVRFGSVQIDPMENAN